MPLMISAVNVDDDGHSYFSKVNVLDSQERERSQAIECWQTWETLPGFYAPPKTVEKPICVALMSGKLEVTTSNGEKRYFSHGEVFLLQDTTGRGHTIRTIGFDPCRAMLMTMKEKMAGEGEGAGPSR